MIFDEQSGEKIRERLGQVPLGAAAEFGGLVGMTHRGQPGRLLHYHDLGIGIANHRFGDRFFFAGFWFLSSGLLHGLENCVSSISS